MARVALGLVIALVVSPGLAGCLGGEGDQPGRAAADAELPSLPEGIEVTDAEVVTYEPGHVRFVWEDAGSRANDGSVNESVGVQPPGPGEPAATRMHVPPSPDLHLTFTLSWETRDDLDFSVNNASETLCDSTGLSNPDICEVGWLPASDEPRVWDITVLVHSEWQRTDPSNPEPVEVPFTLEVDVRPTGPFGVPGGPPPPGGES